ncbi:Putative conjugal transfer proteinc/MT3759 [Bacillus subtilis]|uniref:ATPase, T2SS/T4P/T4SS family n=1 Tax=Bacillus TaxID=1386 RepID=UPI0006A8F15E|nr:MULTISPECIES: ATPase, T2SS/T4P/T4SS family [Bacillus]MBU2661797.1 CpaF/VirB11 family protein [Bacillus cabrialesii]PAO69904.1 hypothetical protein CIK44_04085 [Bacillus sp. X2(2017)]CUB18116.1 Putative conjugal transfer proteinc/MT3759 [Bacillus subtilis]CUB57043.1 Putative conjugal transfer proteinc/MT3759 [Bacillus subtilis]
MIQSELMQEIYEDYQMRDPELVLKAFTSQESREVMKELLANEYSTLLDNEDKVEYVMQELVGLGVIESIIKDESVTDIQFNGTKLIVHSRDKPPYTYDEGDIEIDEKYIEKIIKKFAHAVGKDFTPKEWRLNAQLNNLRLNAIHKVRSPYGHTMSLRVSRESLVLTKDNFSTFAPMYVYDFLKAAVESKNNIILAGETGAGKTELQKLLTSFIKPHEVIIVIEDVTEGHYKTLFEDKNILSWLAFNNDDLEALIEEGLRNNPDWLTVTEIRNKGAMQLYTAILTGHRIISSIHSKTTRAIPKRFVNMVKSSFNIDEKQLLDDLNDYLGIGAFVKKDMIDGASIRYLSEIVEFRADGNHITIFKQRLTDDGLVCECNPYSEDLQAIFDEERVNYNLDYMKEWKNEKEVIHS